MVTDPENECTDPEGCTQEKIDAGECCKEEAPIAASASQDYTPGPGKVGPGDEEDSTEEESPPSE